MRVKIRLAFFFALMFISLIYAQTYVKETNEQEALQAITDSQRIISDMKENNFSVNYMEDKLIEAKRVFEQAKYAEILRGNINATEKEKVEAKNSLRLIKWENINYSAVLIYTEDIKKRKEVAFLLLDKINIEEDKLNGVSNETKVIFEQAKTAFSEERYNDSEKLLLDFQNAVEKEKQKYSTLSGLKKGAMNFFQRYWTNLLIILVLASVAGFFIYKMSEKKY